MEQKNKYQNIEGNGSSVINTESGNKRHFLVLPYQGEQESRLVKSLERNISKLLPETTQLEFGFGFIGNKLSMHFQKKNKTKFGHNHDVVYFGTCPENNCSGMLVKAHVVSVRE